MQCGIELGQSRVCAERIRLVDEAGEGVWVCMGEGGCEVTAELRALTVTQGQRVLH